MLATEERRIEDTIDVLAKLVHPRDGHPKLIAMIEAYLDESGIHEGAALCVIAGYFGGRGQWKKFERDWRKALRDGDVPLEKFHALNLMKRRGFFHGWSDDEQASLLDALANAVTAYRIYPASFVSIVEDFLSFSITQRRFFTGAVLRGKKLVTSGNPNRPYFQPFMRCLKRVASYAPSGGKAHFFFGLDRPFGKYAQALYKNITDSPFDVANKERLGTIAFPLAKETPQLQAADLLAFLTVEHVKEHGPHGYTQPTSWLRKILDNTRMQEDHVLFDKAHLQATLEKTYEFFDKNWDGDKTQPPDLEPIRAFDREDEDDLPGN